MNLSAIQNVEDLQNLGTLEDLRLVIQQLVSPLKVEAATYEDLLKIVQLLQENWVGIRSGTFVSRQAEIIFYLTKLDGQLRNDLIGLTDEHYEDQDKAKQWLRKLNNLVHPDKGGDEAAFKILKKIYEQVTLNDFDGGEDE
ncbi:hypothetical protein [Pseudomonas migulae]|uniref:J domain-containing protein n=1 Tax=Pseudomonas migulae TaxID=78543 RepID=A0ABY8N218_9PSED|nr:hypothetical protein [Pseudomonas migulae]WGK93351.1 hypothetical protein MOQ58_14520 [Pseudomonas migulae]